MLVRGAPLIGVTAAYGVALALKDGAGDKALRQSCDTLAATRPTAVNLHWALTRMQRCLLAVPVAQRRAAAWTEARAIAAEDAAANRRIGAHGLVLIENIARRPASLMTHCNAGWLATAAWGTALAPMYCAREAGLPLHVYVSETRPRNQGLLTAWELHEARIPHTLIADNAAGLLLREGKVDMVIVGADRIAANGDTANKVGTYLKALAAADCGVPFYVAAPLSTIDRDCPDGAHIPIEARDGGELRHVGGLDRKGKPATVAIAPDSLAVANPAFDVTPARLISGIVTERGVCAPGQLHTLFGNGP
jgi:methylthioribose-1-phosphate isomerase